ncbi:MAG: hypothetical protein U5R49_16850 [Deltaproteobacteria bacterium]|nr:hypothetical protein [Deltaproteobacteria bacterium]
MAGITQEVLDNIPPKVHVRPGDLATRRGRFERLDAELRFLLEGDEEGLRTMLTRSLFTENSGAGLRLITLLYDSGDEVALGAMGRMMLDNPACPDRETIQAMVDELNRTPARWEKSLDAFVANPSIEAWDSLMRFCPLETHFQRVKNTLRTLKARGVDPNLLFILGSKDGLLPEAIGWVEEGLVDPETILAQEKTMHSDEMRGTLLGLAAHAYFHRGDRFNTVRYLKEAVALSETVRFTVEQIEDRADPELRDMMGKAGLRLKLSS